MPSIANLAIDFSTNVAQVANDMSKVRGSVESTIKGIKSVAATAFATFVPLATIHQALDMAGALHDLGEQTDFAASSLQVYRTIAGQNTVDAETFNGAIQKLTVNIGKARDGGTEMVAAFAKVGVSAKDLATQSPEQLFVKMQDGFAKIGSQSDRAAIAVSLFGKAGGSGMAVMMAQGSAAIHAQADALQRMGGIMSNELVASAAQASDELGTVGTVMQTAFNSGFLDQLQSQFHLIGESMGGMAMVSRDAGEVFGYVAAEAISMGNDVMKIIDVVFQWAGGMERVKAIAVTAVAGIKVAFLSMQETLVTATLVMFKGLEKLDQGIDAVMAKFGKTAVPNQFIKDGVESMTLAMQGIGAEIDKVMLDADEAIRKNATPLTLANEALKKSQDGVAASAKNTAPSIAHMASTIKSARGEAQKLSGDFKTAAHEVDASMKQMADSLDSAFNGLLSGLFSHSKILAPIAGDLASLLNPLVGSLFSGMFGGARAAGGGIDAGKTYLVGEEGPELFTSGSNGNITPNHMLGGGSTIMNVTVINNTPAKITQTESKNSSGGRDIILTLDDMVSKLASDPGSKTSQAISRSGSLTSR